MEKNKIFVCYRREDAAWTRSIYEKLEREFGENSVFMDVEAIAAGRNFEEVILGSLRECFAAVVVIGPTWLDPVDEETDSRLHDVNDYVHLEIFTCLAAGIRIVPVLVSGAQMPKPDLLPRNLRALTKINARTIPPDDLFDHAVSLLVASLRDAYAETRPAETAMPAPDVAPQRANPWRFISLALAACLIAVFGWAYLNAGQIFQTENTLNRLQVERDRLTAQLEASQETVKKLERDVKSLKERLVREGTVPRKIRISYDRSDVHVGDRDEGLSNWPASVGPCYGLAHDYSGPAEQVAVSYEAFGMETAMIRIGDQSFQLHRQARDNNWRGPFQKVFDVNGDLQAEQAVTICSNRVPDGDFDNFRIRNVSVIVMN